MADDVGPGTVDERFDEVGAHAILQSSFHRGCWVAKHFSIVAALMTPVLALSSGCSPGGASPGSAGAATGLGEGEGEGETGRPEGGGGASACVPGQSVGCVCPDGQVGAQSCAGDGARFLDCRCIPSVGEGEGEGEDGAQGAGGGDAGGDEGEGDGEGDGADGDGGHDGDGLGTPLCVPGQAIGCACANGRDGAQACAEDGLSYAECVCEGGQAGGEGEGEGEGPAPRPRDFDGDGVPDGHDAFPFDPGEQRDADGDGVGDNADPDDDDDGVPDDQDPFPRNPGEHRDSDGDGIGDNADADDDNDGVRDDRDAFPLDPDEARDTDGDGVGDNADADDDGDGVPDDDDLFPLQPGEHGDADDDGVGDNADPDDDNDGVPDAEDAFPLDPNESRDSDDDGVGDNADGDDDDDGVPDGEDAFPLDPEEDADIDGDGVGDNAECGDDPPFADCAWRSGLCAHAEPRCDGRGAWTCEPQPPIPYTPDGDFLCDGLDNDCDGRVDEDLVVDGLGVGHACAGIGRCAAGGIVECAGVDSLRCSVDPGGSADRSVPERCNGVDDDCDGDIDEGQPEAGQPCQGPDPGACGAGISECVDGVLVCIGNGAPVDEVCNGLDDDCDGSIDNGYEIGGVCEEGLGLCTSVGAFVCDAGGDGVVCGAQPGEPEAEVCDGLDNDCDGDVDEELPDLGEVCEVGRGECARQGVTRCVGGEELCGGGPGAPRPERCDGLDNDCDDEVDEDFGLGEACAVGVGACAVEASISCGDDGWPRCDGVAAEPAEEACDGIDNDCDGALDEGLGLELLTDVDNCGACGNVCDLNDAASGCILGRCVVTECDPGFIDADRLHANGCEVRLGGGVLYVDDDSPGPGDGTQVNPFPSIQAAVAVLSPGDVIDVAPGIYLGPVEIEVHGVTLRGSGADQTMLVGTPGMDPVLSLEASEDSTVMGLLISNATTALVLGPRNTLVDAVIERSRNGVKAGGWHPSMKLRIFRNIFREMTCSGFDDALGISARDDAEIFDNVLDGCPISANGNIGGNTIRNARRGITGSGVITNNVVEDSGELGIAIGSDTRLSGNVVRNLRGDLFAPNGSYRGRDVVGIRISGTDNHLSANTLHDLQAGVSDSDDAGRYHGNATGIWLQDDAYSNRIDDSNTYDGEPIVYVYGQQGGELANYNLVGDIRPTNLGKLVVIASVGVTVRNNDVAGFLGYGVGDAPYRSSGGAIGRPGESGAGILVQDSTSIVLEGNDVHDIAGGSGGIALATNRWGSGGPGGPGAGIWVRNSSSTRISNNVVRDIRGGAGSEGKSSRGFFADPNNEGRGGVGSGIRIEDSPEAFLQGNTVRTIMAGRSPTNRAGEKAVGIHTIAAHNLHSRNDLVHSLSDADVSTGVLVDRGCPGMTYLDNITISSITATDTAYGVSVHQDCGLNLKNAIVSGIGGTGVTRLGANLPLPVNVSYTALWANETDLGEVLEGEGVIRVNPQFTHQPLPYALAPDSPCIDAGDLASACDEEPVDAGGQCRVDMGHLGGTADARAAN